jgi:hypothetical protein
MRMRPVVVRWSAAALLSAPGPAAPAPGTYWQEPACSADYRWCVEWVRLRDDGRMEMRCAWSADRARQTAQADARRIVLLDEAGRRSDPVPPSGTAAPGAGERDVRTSFTFPGPAAGARRFTLRDETNGIAIPEIVLDPTRRSSSDASRALLGGLLAADAIEVDDRWNGLGRPRDRRLQLSRDADGGFTGRETIGGREAERNGGTTPPEPRTVRLTKEQARQFLETLVGSAAIGGTYRPRIVLDSSPHLEIRVGTGERSWTFSSESVGTDHAPWALLTDGRSLVVPSSHPGRALRFLRSVVDGTPEPALLQDPDDRDGPIAGEAPLS